MTDENEDVLDDVDFDFSLIDEVEDIIDDEETSTIPCARPKQCLISFLTCVDMDEPYEFIYPGTRTQAMKYIHAMRVELSRMREKVRKLGKRNIQFKVRIVSIVLMPNETAIKASLPAVPFQQVTLMRTQQKANNEEPLDESVLSALTDTGE